MPGPLIFSNPFDYHARHSPAHTPCVERPNSLSRFDSHSCKPHPLSRRHGPHNQDLCEADIWTLKHIDTDGRWCSPINVQKDEAYSQPRSRRNAITSITIEGDGKATMAPDDFHYAPEKPSLSRKKTNVFDLIKPVDDSVDKPSPSGAKTKPAPNPQDLCEITVNLTPTVNFGCFEPSRSESTESTESVDYVTYQRRPALGYIFDPCPGYPQVQSPAAATGLPQTRAEAELAENLAKLDDGAGPRRPELHRRVSRFTFVKVKTLFDRR